jgi:arylsulfatase A-like enzyme
MTVAVVGSLWAVACAAAEPPNIIFILSDDLSYRDLGCYGQQHIETPNLDRLCREAMRFTQAYAGARECAPTRCSLMTGLHMGHARIRLNRSARGQDHLLDEDVTVAEVLKQAGGSPKYTEYPEVGHNSWSKAYASQLTWEWLFAQRRTD